MGTNVIGRRLVSPSAGVLEVRAASGATLYAERFNLALGDGPARAALAAALMQAICAEVARVAGESRARGSVPTLP